MACQDSRLWDVIARTLPLRPAIRIPIVNLSNDASWKGHEGHAFKALIWAVYEVHGTLSVFKIYLEAYHRYFQDGMRPVTGLGNFYDPSLTPCLPFIIHRDLLTSLPLRIYAPTNHYVPVRSSVPVVSSGIIPTCTSLVLNLTPHPNDPLPSGPPDALEPGAQARTLQILTRPVASWTYGIISGYCSARTLRMNDTRTARSGDTSYNYAQDLAALPKALDSHCIGGDNSTSYWIVENETGANHPVYLRNHDFNVRFYLSLHSASLTKPPLDLLPRQQSPSLRDRYSSLDQPAAGRCPHGSYWHLRSYRVPGPRPLLFASIFHRSIVNLDLN